MPSVLLEESGTGRLIVLKPQARSYWYVLVCRDWPVAANVADISGLVAGRAALEAGEMADISHAAVSAVVDRDCLEVDSARCRVA